MMTFSLSFEDYEEAEIGLTAFAATCRQINETLKARPKRSRAAAAQLEKTLAEASSQLDIVDAVNEAPAAKDFVSEALDAPSERSVAPKQRAKRGTAKVAEKPAEEPAAEKATIAVRAPTLADCRTLIAANKDKPGAITLIKKAYSKAGIENLKNFTDESKAAAIHKALTEAFLDDSIPF